jgi:hypothetical protein
MTTDDTPLARARRRDVDRRRQRVHQALADMHADGSEITISPVASRAKVHRSFIHRHADLHAAVLQATADTTTAPPPASTAISHRSVLAETPTCTNKTAGSPSRSPTWKTGYPSCSASKPSTAAAWAPRPGPPPSTPSSRPSARPSWTSAECWKNATRNSPQPARPTGG